MKKQAIGIIFAGFFTVFLAFATRYAYGLLLPHMLPTLNVSRAEAGIVYSTYFLTYTICSPFIGLLADRAGSRILLTLFVALLGTGAFLMSFASSVLQAAAFFGMVGVGHSACWIPLVALVQKWVPEKRRGAALALVDLGSATGIVVWSLIIPLIVSHYGWRAAWMSIGLSALVIAFLNFFLIKDAPPGEEQEDVSQALKSPLLPVRQVYALLFRERNFWLIGFSYMFIAFSILIPFTFITSYAVKELHVSFSSAAGLIAVMATSGFTGKICLGYFSDIVGRINVMMGCCLLVALGGLGMAAAEGYAALFISAIVLGFGYGAIWPVWAASTRDFFQKEIAGSIIGLWTVLLGIGSSLSPITAGMAVDISGSYEWAFILVASAAFLSLLLLLPIALSANRERLSR